MAYANDNSHTIENFHTFDYPYSINHSDEDHSKDTQSHPASHRYSLANANLDFHTIKDACSGYVTGSISPIIQSGESNSESNSKAYGHPLADSNNHLYSNNHSNSLTNPSSYCNPHKFSYAYPDPNQDPHLYTNTHSYVYIDTNTNQYANTKADFHIHAQANQDAD